MQVAGVAQCVAAQSAFGAEAVEIGPWFDIGAPGSGKEAGKAGTKRLDIGATPIAAGETVIEHPFSRQPAHLHEPIDDSAGSGDREIAFIQG
jgi:hypothetical protein